MNLFKIVTNILKSTPPLELVTVKGIGEMRYDREYESWVSYLNDLKLYFPYEGEDSPRNDIIEYGKNIIRDIEIILKDVECAANELISKVGDTSELINELNNLKIDSISVNRHKNEFWFMIFFKEVNIKRLWRYEAYGINHERKILTFDS